MKILIFCVFLLTGTLSYAQYWFGPKIGGHRIDHVYQDNEYKQDTVRVIPNHNFQGGFVFHYSSDDRYSFRTEIVYERIGIVVKNRDVTPIHSRMTNHFISLPLQLRMSFNQGSTHYYINGGPKISYWVSGNGYIDLDEFLDDSIDPINYNIVFKESKKVRENQLALPGANRFQYALTVGAGSYVDLAVGGRLEIDFRYSFGHSNMGFNRNPDVTFSEYYDNLTYRNFMLSVSVAYLMEYNAQLKRKGASTNTQGKSRR
ncbi:MAG: outer membrane beta-barrel protein [Cyclobacteriaceae bacterium]|tara:strand:+ start:9235 stop:10011 length:777 start_codon:yes stop_codon:yes gene_type:complete